MKIKIPELKSPILDKIWESVPENVKDSLRQEQTRVYIISGAAVLLLVLYAVFMILPTFSSLSKASGKVKELNDKINLVNSRIKRLDEMSNKLTDLTTELGGYSKGLPQEKEIPEFIEKLSAVARKSDVKILSITPYELKAVKGKKKEGTYYSEMPIVITAKSGYHQLGYFVSNLEREKRFITIKGLQVQYDRNFPRRHNVEITLKTYVAVENEKKK